MSNRTTLEIVLFLSNGALLVPLKKTASILGMETQTLRNQLSEKTFPLTPSKPASRVFFAANDIADLVDRSKEPKTTPKRGRPRKSERISPRGSV